MFDTSHGWLRYKPHAHFSLPEIVQVNDIEVTASHHEPGIGQVIDDFKEIHVKVPFCDKSGNVKFTRPLYQLRWPGQYQDSPIPGKQFALNDQIPIQIASNLGVYPHRIEVAQRSVECLAAARKQLGGKAKASDVEDLALSLMAEIPPSLEQEISLKALVLEGLPEVLPTPIAYHLAVNHHVYFPKAMKVQESFPHPVGALNADRLEQVLHARFAMDPEAVATCQYLKWMAEGHWDHPLFKGFDTMVREHLMDIAVTIVQMYFWMLQDYVYDHDSRYYAKDESKYHWAKLAGYLFWINRTGGGLTADHAGIEPMWMGSVERFREAMPDVIAGLKQWRETDSALARARGHVTGKDPSVTDEPVVGPVLDPGPEGEPLYRSGTAGPVLEGFSVFASAPKSPKRTPSAAGKPQVPVIPKRPRR